MLQHFNIYDGEIQIFWQYFEEHHKIVICHGGVGIKKRC